MGRDTQRWYCKETVWSRRTVQTIFELERILAVYNLKTTAEFAVAKLYGYGNFQKTPNSICFLRITNRSTLNTAYSSPSTDHRQNTACTALSKAVNV